MSDIAKRLIDTPPQPSPESEVLPLMACVFAVTSHGEGFLIPHPNSKLTSGQSILLGTNPIPIRDLKDIYHQIKSTDAQLKLFSCSTAVWEGNRGDSNGDPNLLAFGFTDCTGFYTRYNGLTAIEQFQETTSCTFHFDEQTNTWYSRKPLTVFLWDNVSKIQDYPASDVAEIVRTRLGSPEKIVIPFPLSFAPFLAQLGIAPQSWDVWARHRDDLGYLAALGILRKKGIYKDSMFTRYFVSDKLAQKELWKGRNCNSPDFCLLKDLTPEKLSALALAGNGTVFVKDAKANNGYRMGYLKQKHNGWSFVLHSEDEWTHLESFDLEEVNPRTILSVYQSLQHTDVPLEDLYLEAAVARPQLPDGRFLECRLNVVEGRSEWIARLTPSRPGELRANSGSAKTGVGGETVHYEDLPEFFQQLGETWEQYYQQLNSDLTNFAHMLLADKVVGDMIRESNGLSFDIIPNPIDKQLYILEAQGCGTTTDTFKQQQSRLLLAQHLDSLRARGIEPPPEDDHEPYFVVENTSTQPPILVPYWDGYVHNSKAARRLMSLSET